MLADPWKLKSSQLHRVWRMALSRGQLCVESQKKRGKIAIRVAAFRSLADGRGGAAPGWSRARRAWIHWGGREGRGGAASDGRKSTATHAIGLGAAGLGEQRATPPRLRPPPPSSRSLAIRAGGEDRPHLHPPPPPRIWPAGRRGPGRPEREERSLRSSRRREHHRSRGSPWTPHAARESAQGGERGSPERGGGCCWRGRAAEEGGATEEEGGGRNGRSRNGQGWPDGGETEEIERQSRDREEEIRLGGFRFAPFFF